MSTSATASNPPALPDAGDSATTTMVVHTRARDLVEWLLPHTAKFPREQRHLMARHIASLGLGVHDALIRARHLAPGPRAAALLDADIQLDQLRQHLHLAWRWQWISGGQFQHVSGLTDELGRLIGGWRRAKAALPQAQ